MKLAGCLTQRCTEAVPVFWMASEDHDWEEVRAAEFTACDGRLAHTDVPASMHTEGAPVGAVRIDDSITDTLKRLLDLLPTTEFSDDVAGLVRDAYAPGRTYTEAFARMLTALTRGYGLVLLDPLDARLKRLAAPLYAEAARRAPELAAALEARSRELEADGYHAQVHTSADAFPLFLHTDDSRRVAITRGADGRYRAKGGRRSGHTCDELAEWARASMSDSAQRALRAVVRILLPTIADYAAGRVALAQTDKPYRLLRAPPPRSSPREPDVVERRTSALERST